MLWTPFLLSLASLAAVLELVRRRLLREELSALWVAAGVGALLLSCFEPARQSLAPFFEGPSAMAMLALAAAFLAITSLWICLKSSRLLHQQRHLAQEFARLNRRIDDLSREPTE